MNESIDYEEGVELNDSTTAEPSLRACAHKKGKCGQCKDESGEAVCSLCCLCPKASRGKPQRGSAGVVRPPPRNLIPQRRASISARAAVRIAVDSIAPSPPRSIRSRPQYRPQSGPSPRPVVGVATALGLGPRGTSHLPSTRTASSLADIPASDVARIRSFMEASIRSLASAVCPNDGDALAEPYLTNVTSLPLQRLHSALPRGSVEMRTVRALAVAGSANRADASAMLGLVAREACEGEESSSGLQGISGAHGDEGRNADGGYDVYQEDDVDGMSADDDELCEDDASDAIDAGANESSEFRGPAQREKRRGLLASTTYTKARKYFLSLSEGRPIEKVKRVVNRVSDASLSHVIEFLLHADNSQILAWGTKSLRVGARILTLPAVTRKKSKASLYRQYSAESSPPGVNLIGRSLFYLLASKVTAREQVNRQSVDYVVCTLVKEMVDSFTRVIHIVETGDARKQLLFELERVSVFLKHGYAEAHVRTDGDADGFHCSSFALHGEGLASREVGCVPCQLPFDFVTYLRSLIPPDRADAVEVTNEAELRFKLYCGHAQRVKAQQEALSRMLEEVKFNRMHHRIVVVLDWKMKMEPVWFRETQKQFYGKKGMAWHGAAVYFLPTELPPDDPVAGEFAFLFLDSILGTESTQDWCSVAGVVECVVRRVKLELPHVTEVSFVSDNASCYNNTILPVVLPFICGTHGLSLKSYLHGETCDGKGPCDAHFSVANFRISMFVRQGNDVATPMAIAVALNSDGGIANTIADVINTDRSSSGLRAWSEMATTQKKNLKRIGRAGEIVYEAVDGAGEYELCLRTYSGYGSPQRLRVSRAGIVENIVVVGETQEFESHPGDTSDSDQEAIAIETEYGEAMSESDEDEDLDILECLEPAEQESGGSTHSQIRTTLQALATPGRETGAMVVAPGSLRRCSLRLGRLRKKRLMGMAACGDDVAAGGSQGRGNGSDDVGALDRLPTCPTCSARFLSHVRFIKHIESCRGAKETLSTLSRAVCRASEYLQRPESSVLALQPLMSGIVLHNPTQMPPAVKAGWAKRPRAGKRYGTSYVERFESELQTWFDDGEIDKGKKVSSAIMLERLQALYPSRLDLPSEEGIKTFIAKAVKRKKTAVTGGTKAASGRPGLADVYVAVLEEMLEEPEATKWTPKKMVSIFDELVAKNVASGKSYGDRPKDSQLKYKWKMMKQRVSSEEPHE